MHKLQSSITSESWKTLSSRPIRGAESDPMKEPSRVLYKLLKIMLDQFRGKFSSLGFDKSLEFPVLRGCDDYLDRLHDVKLVSSRMMETVMLTADFSDAFTETGIDRLQDSICVVGKIIDLDNSTTDLMKKLVILVFSNCYFYTPNGLYRQTRGMPMGDYSSRLVS